MSALVESEGRRCQVTAGIELKRCTTMAAFVPISRIRLTSAMGLKR